VNYSEKDTLESNAKLIVELSFKCSELNTENLLLQEKLALAVECLKSRKCDEVINYEGSGMFNKHDPKCVKCETLAKIQGEKMEGKE